MRIGAIATNLYGNIQNNYQIQSQDSNNKVFGQVSFKASGEDKNHFNFGNDSEFQARRFGELIGNIRTLLEKDQEPETESDEKQSVVDREDIVQKLVSSLISQIVSVLSSLTPEEQDRLASEGVYADGTENYNSNFDLDDFDDDPFGYEELADNAVDQEEKIKYLTSLYEYIGSKIEEAEGNSEKQIELLNRRISKCIEFVQKEQDEEYKELWADRIYEDFSEAYSLMENASLRNQILTNRANFALQFASFFSKEETKNKWFDHVYGSLLTCFNMNEFPENIMVFQKNLGILESFEDESTTPEEKEKWADRINDSLNRMIMVGNDDIKPDLYKAIVDFGIDHLALDPKEKWADRVYEGLTKLPQYMESKEDQIQYWQHACSFSGFYEQQSTLPEQKSKWTSRVNRCEEELTKLIQ